MIDVQQLSKAFSLSKQQQKEQGLSSGEILAVDQVSFQCRPGRIFSLLGPNGAGKTTILRIIATILRPSSGQVKVCGHGVENEGQKVRACIGFLTGTTGLYKRLTPNEILQYFGNLYQIPKPVFKERKEKLYSLLDMHDFAKKRVSQLSTGMKQKVSIARTMIHDPEVLIFDEPTSGLDVITAEHIIDLIRQCRTDHKTVIFSSHIMSEVDLLCDDLAVIHKGKLIHQSTMIDFRSQMQAHTLTQEFIRLVNAHEKQI